jgi:hypothetical protein
MIKPLGSLVVVALGSLATQVAAATLSTGVLFAPAGGLYACAVRNVGTKTINVMCDCTGNNGSASSEACPTLAPGDTCANTIGGVGLSFGFFSCTVTTSSKSAVRASLSVLDSSFTPLSSSDAR